MMRDNLNGKQVPAYRRGEFFTQLSGPALADLESLLFPSAYPARAAIFTEEQPAAGIVVVLEGEVKLSINSSDGRRLSFCIARAGDVLGLTAALSGHPYEMTAETLYPAKVAHVTRKAFLHFLALNPDAYEAVAREASHSFSLAFEQLRTVGLSSSVPERLARLLLAWGESGEKSEDGARCRVALTHEEIGEFIGASRETVSRVLSVFKSRRLVSRRGHMIVIPSRRALESYACG